MKALAARACSSSGATRQFKVGTGSWTTVSIGTTTNSSPGFIVGKNASGTSPNVNLTDALVWVYSDDLSDAELDDNYDWADAEIGSRGGTLE